MGGRFGEMSTLNNYMHQSFNMRGRDARLFPFYDLVASITAEEFGHVEAGRGDNQLAAKRRRAGRCKAERRTLALEKLNSGNGIRHQFLNNGNSSSGRKRAGGKPWQGDYVFNSGNLVLDLLA